jgi:2-polyprenyl-6-methoxyphenol hydroxylase-like FAD-dependent oxidoreductase
LLKQRINPMTTSLLTDKKVAIIGGGPVGLTLAVLLQQRGAHVSVYERDSTPEARISGGTLDLHAHTGQLALQAAGLLPLFYQVARPTPERVADVHGTVLLDEQPTAATAHERPEIDRRDLRQLLLQQLQPGTVAWGQEFEALGEEDGRFRLRFAGQSDQLADVVIGANGGRSKVRPYVIDTAPVYTGTFLIQGEIPHPQVQCPAFCALVNYGNLMVRAGGRMLFAQTKGSGALNYYASFRQPLTWLAQQGLSAQHPAALVQLLVGAFADWADVFGEAFRTTQDFALLPMYRLPLQAFRTRPVTRALTLIGDAAHLMPPFAGVGVNMGLLDALTLADNLTNGHFSSLEAAIEAYERAMYGYAHEAQEGTAAAERDIHSAMSDVDLLAGREAHNQTL